MADLLIKGMEMPTEGGVIGVYKLDGEFYIYDCKREFPIVELPPHGRLIDADELAIRVKSQIQSSFCNQHNATLVFAQGLKLFVENAPTVIEASEDGEQDV